MISRRLVLLGGSALIGLGGHAIAREGSFPVERSEAEWRRQLGAARYRILRQDGTEKAYSSPLDQEKRSGVFACAGCRRPAFQSQDKYDSRTGWPSFTAPIPGSVGTSQDTSLWHRPDSGPFAAHAAAISGTSSTTVPRRPENATA